MKFNKFKLRTVTTALSLMTCAVLTGCMMSMSFSLPPEIMAEVEEALASGNLEEIPFQDPEITDLLNKGYSIEEANSILREESSSGSTSTPTTTPKPTCSHEWKEEVVKQATCTEAGSTKKTCSKCKETTTVKVAKLEHDYQPTETVDGTCETIGYVVQTCTLCGDSFKVETDYGDHLFFTTDVLKETCEADGCVTKACNVCGVETYETIPALGHKMSEERVVTKDATCLEDGAKAYKCENEGCELIKDEIVVVATGHIEGKTLTLQDATFFKDGYAETLCENCGEVLKEVTLPATGGVWRYVTVGGVVVVVLGGVVAGVCLMKKRKRV